MSAELVVIVVIAVGGSNRVEVKDRTTSILGYGRLSPKAASDGRQAFPRFRCCRRCSTQPRRALMAVRVAPRGGRRGRGRHVAEVDGPKLFANNAPKKSYAV